MSRGFQCAFGLGTSATGMEFTTSSGTLAVQNTVSRPGSSGWALRVSPTTSTGFVRYHYAASDQAAVGFQRFALRADTLPSANTTICRFQDTGNNPTGQLRLTTAGKLQLWTASGVQIGSDSAAITSGDSSWHIIEIKTDATGAGVLEGRLNGVSYANGANSAQGQWSRLVIGVIGTNATADLYFTDWALNTADGSFQNSWCGNGYIIYQRPGGAGDANAWLKTNGSTAGDANNYQLVDEVTPNDTTDLVQTNTLNAQDMYALTASGIGAGDTVNAVLVGVRMRNNTADATVAAKLQIKSISGGTITQGSEIKPNSASFATNASAEPRNYTLVAHRDPDGNAWNRDTLNSAQIGAICTATGTNRWQMSTVWATVDYTPSTGTPLGTASETDTAQPLGRTKTRALGLASETGTAQALGRAKSRAAAMASETDMAVGLARRKIRALTPASETSTAQALGRVKTRALGAAAETETAIALGKAKTVALGPATETSTATALGRAKTNAPGIAAETDTAQLLAAAKTRALTAASETGTAQALGRSKRATASPAAEVGQAMPIVRSGFPLTLGVATETNTAVALGAAKTRALDLASGTDTAQPLAGAKARTIASAAETDTATALGHAWTKLLNAASETGTAMPIAASGGGITRPGKQTVTARPAGRLQAAATTSRMEVTA